MRSDRTARLKSGVVAGLLAGGILFGIVWLFGYITGFRLGFPLLIPIAAIVGIVAGFQAYAVVDDQKPAADPGDDTLALLQKAAEDRAKSRK